MARLDSHKVDHVSPAGMWNCFEEFSREFEWHVHERVQLTAAAAVERLSPLTDAGTGRNGLGKFFLNRLIAKNLYTITI